MNPVGRSSISPMLMTQEHQHIQDTGASKAPRAVESRANEERTPHLPSRLSLNGRPVRIGSFKLSASMSNKQLLASLLTPQGSVEETSKPSGQGVPSKGETWYKYGARTPDQAHDETSEAVEVRVMVDSSNQLRHLLVFPDDANNAPDAKPLHQQEFQPSPTDLNPVLKRGMESLDVAQKRRKVDSELTDAGSKVADAIRQGIGNAAQRKMLEKGPEWELGPNDPKSAAGISSANLSLLRRELTPLRDYEKAFLGTFLATRLYATHATRPGALSNKDGSIALFSRQKLSERGIGFPPGNTEGQDIEDYASDDHVFFSLEAGDTPQKPSSRFGTELLRFNFEHEAIQKTGMLNLVDPATGLPPQAYDRFPAIESHREMNEKNEALENLSGLDYAPKQSLFHGHQMKPGLALAIIKNCRENVSKSIGEKMLSPKNDDDINTLLNGLFRPSIMVPRHFFGIPSDRAKIELSDVKMEED